MKGVDTYQGRGLIADPIHQYILYTRPDGAPSEATEQDLIDSAWMQRLRRVPQLQSARWVFPAAGRPSRRAVADGRAPPRHRPRPVRPLLRRQLSRRLGPDPRARGPADHPRGARRSSSRPEPEPVGALRGG